MLDIEFTCISSETELFYIFMKLNHLYKNVLKIPVLLVNRFQINNNIEFSVDYVFFNFDTRPLKKNPKKNWTLHAIHNVVSHSFNIFTVLE